MLGYACKGETIELEERLRKEVVLEESRYVHACMVHSCRKMAVQCHVVNYSWLWEELSEMLILESPICETVHKLS